MISDNSLWPFVSDWEIAAHNESVSRWYIQLHTDWKLCRTEAANILYDIDVDQALDVRKVTRSILASSLEGSSAFVFMWPPDTMDEWVLLCPDPACHQAPIQTAPSAVGSARLEAQRHFQGHKMTIPRHEDALLVLFGYRGKYYDADLYYFTLTFVVINDTKRNSLSCVKDNS